MTLCPLGLDPVSMCLEAWGNQIGSTVADLWPDVQMALDQCTVKSTMSCVIGANQERSSQLLRLWRRLRGLDQPSRKWQLVWYHIHTQAQSGVIGWSVLRRDTPVKAYRSFSD